MARFGPWILLHVEDLMRDKSRWEHCERCDEHIRYIYMCKVDGETKEWRIGSTPTAFPDRQRQVDPSRSVPGHGEQI